MKVTRLFDLLDNQLERFPKEDALACKSGDRWTKYSTRQFKDTAHDLSYGLVARGLRKGDALALIANNRPEWNFVDMAAQLAGVITAPIYPTVSEHDLEYILRHAEVKMAFVSTQELREKVERLAKGLPGFLGVFVFDEGDGHSWKEVLEAGREKPCPEKIAEITSSILPDDLVTLIYTSGTTGQPKGVMLSHHNILSNCEATEVLCPFHHSWLALSFLPLNHVLERMLSYLYMYYGISIYYAESMDTIGDNLKEVKPQIFVTVPRLLEKVFDKIVTKGEELKGIKKKLFFWALRLGLRYELHGANGWWYEFQLAIANKLIFSKWREALGGKVEAIASGGAALQPRLARVFHAARITVLEGYGLTETSPVIAVNNFQPGCIKFGTVGTVISNVEVKIAEDGEILCRGPNIMLGYYKEPELTKDAIDADGWFHTGDIGEMQEGKFLKITDRKKEIFKTSGGKYIIPQMIENKLKESPFIEQAMVIGENQKFAAALVVPAFAHFSEWGKQNRIDFGDAAALAGDSRARDKVRAEIEKVNKTLGHFETIRKFELLPREFSIEAGEMTPKLSLKRKAIMEANRELVKRIYGEPEK